MKAKFKPLAMTDRVSADCLAQYFGISGRAVRDLAQRGVVVRAGRDFPLSESVRGYCKHLRDLATGRGGESAIASATAERARLARAQADLTETKVRAMRGELVEASAVEVAWSGMLRTVRAGMLAVPSRCAARLPHLSPHDAAEIDAEVRAVLTEVGNS